MTSKPENGQDDLPGEIRRQFRGNGMARYLGSLPNFRVDNDMPEEFVDLLARLAAAESERDGRDKAGHRGAKDAQRNQNGVHVRY